MSTRAQIAIEGSKVLVYKHWDGYPGGILPILAPFVKQFAESRDWDPDYMVARLAQRMCDAAGPDMTGCGVDCEIRGDTAYLYRVTQDGTIRVCKVRKGRDPSDPWNGTAWVTEQTIPLRTNPVPVETP